LEIFRTDTTLARLDEAVCEKFRLELVERDSTIPAGESQLLNTVLGRTNYAHTFDPAKLEQFPFDTVCAVGWYLGIKAGLWEIDFVAIHDRGRWLFQCEGQDEALTQQCAAILNGFRFVP